MLRTAVRMAARIAFARGWRARWRKFSVVSAALIGAVALLFSTGLVRASLTADEVRLARAPFVVDQGVVGPLPAPLHVSMRPLTPNTGASQFTILWLEPGEADSGPLPLPPGLARLPEPGTMVVSPALAQSGLTAEALGSQPSVAGTGPGGLIGREGLVTSDERLAYARPAPGRTLGADEGVQRITGFGNPNPGFRFDFESVISFPDPLTFIAALVSLIVVPTLLLMIGGARALSEIRQRRMQTLLRLGVTPTPIRLVLGLETAMLALPGCLAGLAVYAVTAPHVGRLPPSDVVLHPGAVTMPWLLALVVALVPAVWMGTCGAAGRLARKPSRHKAVRLWHALPAAAGFWLMASNMVSTYDLDRARANLYLGLLLAIVGLPLALPIVARTIGGLLSHSRAASMWLVGKRLRFDPVALARPAGVIAVLVLLAGSTLAIYGRMILIEPEQLVPWRTAPLVINWRGEQPDDQAVAAAALRDMKEVTLLQSGRDVVKAPADSPAAGREVETVVVSSCHELERVAQLLKTPACDTTEKGSVSRELADALFNEVYRVVVVDPGGTVSRSPYSAIAIGPPDTSEIEVHKRLAGLPALNLSRFRPLHYPDPQAGLLLGGFIGGALLLVFGAIREVANRALWYHIGDAAVGRLGLADRHVDTVRRTTIALPIVVAIFVGGIGSILFAIVGRRMEVTVVDLRNVLVAQLGVGAVSLGAVFLAMSTVRRGGDDAIAGE